MRALFEGEHYTGAGTISFRSSRTHWNYCMQWNVSCSLQVDVLNLVRGHHAYVYKEIWTPVLL